MKISFVIPCYNSSKTIPLVVEEILSTVESSDFDFEIILVNDYSPDNTLDVIKGLADKNTNVKIINLAQNFGQASAVLAGFNNVTGDLVVSLDDDGQTPACEVLGLISKLNEGYDLVFASYPDKKHSKSRNLGTMMNQKMANHLLGKPENISTSSYYVARRFVIDNIIKYNNPYPHISGLLLQSTGSIANYNVTHRDRFSGESQYSFKKLFSLWLNGATAFSVEPLRISVILGALFAVFGFLMGIYYIIKRILTPNSSILGWTSLIVTMFIIGGIMLLVLGVIGEYIGRIYISLNNKPQFVIKECINFEDE